jgi:enoyl-CoA hydratase/carnithine racemase
VADDVVLEHDGPVALVRMCRGPHNFFEADVVGAIADAIDSVRTSHRVVVLHSEGRNFCAGANLRGGTSSPFASSGPHLYDQALRLFRQPLPIVAAIQGKAVGGGVGLALAADLRVGGAGTQFIVNFARIGIHQGFGLSVTLPDAVGLSLATDLLYTGRPVEGEEAARVGLLHRLVADPDVLGAAVDVAHTVAESSPSAIQSIRGTLRGSRLDDIVAAFALERREQERLIAERPPTAQ